MDSHTLEVPYTRLLDLIWILGSIGDLRTAQDSRHDGNT